MKRPVVLLAIALVAVACGRGVTDVEPAPGRPTTTVSTTTEAPSSSTTGDDGVATVDSTATTTTVAGAETTTTFVVLPGTENEEAYVELAASGLVLTLDEQGCADESVRADIASGVDRLDAVITAVTDCAAPATVDDFASGLLVAGGQPLPPTEAACVSSRLRTDDAYQPFWAALFAEEPFDFLVAPVDAQDRYLDLFAECVSVGRALSEQIGGVLSPPTVGCIDDLYADQEFVRITIEADLSGDPDELARVNRQIATCLTSDEREALGLG